MLTFDCLHVDISDRTGPYTEERIKELIRRRIVVAHTPLRPCGGAEEWRPADQLFPNLFGRTDVPEIEPPQLDDQPNWYYADEGSGVLGPVTLKQLEILCHEGGVRTESLVYKKGWPQWRPASGIPIVNAFLRA